MLEEFEDATITDHFGFVVEEKSHDYCDVIVYEKFRFQFKMFSVHTKKQRFLRFEDRFQKASFSVTDKCGR